MQLIIFLLNSIALKSKNGQRDEMNKEQQKNLERLDFSNPNSCFSHSSYLSTNLDKYTYYNFKHIIKEYFDTTKS